MLVGLVQAYASAWFHFPGAQGVVVGAVLLLVLLVRPKGLLGSAA
jgi:branched-subunit amino acid ABC-type transport system permease component